MGRDGGLDEEKSDRAVQKVRARRRSGRLPFPGPADEKPATSQ